MKLYGDGGEDFPHPVGAGEGLGGPGIAPAPVICLSCSLRKTTISGGLFEGPDFPLEIREPQATRQRETENGLGGEV